MVVYTFYADIFAILEIPHSKTKTMKGLPKIRHTLAGVKHSKLIAWRRSAGCPQFWGDPHGRACCHPDDQTYYLEIISVVRRLLVCHPRDKHTANTHLTHIARVKGGRCVYGVFAGRYFRPANLSARCTLLQVTKSYPQIFQLIAL